MIYLFHRFFFQIALAVLVTLSALLPAHAEMLSPQDGKAVQTVVQNQLAAFARDDAEKAFSYAAPELRKIIGNSTAFMAMVKNSYPVVYRPASVVFYKPEGLGKDIVQKVQMLDASGASYLAVYNLQRQKDTSWRISGCVVLANQSQTI